jgi:TPR repeat protein
VVSDVFSGSEFDSLDPAVWLKASITSVARGGTVTRNPISDAKAAAAQGDYESAITVLRPLAEAGNRAAQYELGFLALTECELVSGREAFSLFLEASEQGHAEAMYHLATFPEFLSEPFKSPLSDEEAWHWLLRAAEGGCVQAQRDAGASLATGDWREGKVPQDVPAAVAWYRRAAEAGHADAQYNLASMFSEGEGCDRDLPAAREWLRRAVAGGYEYADGLLAHLDSLK